MDTVAEAFTVAPMAWQADSGLAPQGVDAPDDRELYGGLIRLHILRHAVHGPIFGMRIMEELARHGYKLSAGTLYPMLHGMERLGYLTSREELYGGRRRRMYRATPLGQKTLANAKIKVQKLFGELLEEEPALVSEMEERRDEGGILK